MKRRFQIIVMILSRSMRKVMKGLYDMRIFVLVAALNWNYYILIEKRRANPLYVLCGSEFILLTVIPSALHFDPIFMASFSAAMKIHLSCLLAILKKKQKTGWLDPVLIFLFHTGTVLLYNFSLLLPSGGGFFYPIANLPGTQKRHLMKEHNTPTALSLILASCRR